MWKSRSCAVIAAASPSVKFLIPCSVLKWYFTQYLSPTALYHRNVWLP